MNHYHVDYYQPESGGSFEIITGGAEQWFWQACFPGCIPDGDLMGPFDSLSQTIEDIDS